MAISVLTAVLVAVVGGAILPRPAQRPSNAPGSGTTGRAGPNAAPAMATATGGGGVAAAEAPQTGPPAVAGAVVIPSSGTAAPGVGSNSPPSSPSNEDRPTPARPASASTAPARGDRVRADQPSGAEARATARAAGGGSGTAAESAGSGAVAIAPGDPSAAPAPGGAGAPGGASQPTAAITEPDKVVEKLTGRSADARPEEIPEAAKDPAKESSPESATKETTKDTTKETTRDKAKDKTDEQLSAGDGHTPPDCSLPDKDIARESWRRNWPTLCKGAEADRVSLFIPLKGTLDGETHELRQASHEVRINLPAGESLLTLRQYKVRRSGFKDLRIFPTDSGGTRLRLKLSSGTGEPSFDMKDGYAKITITAPRSASTD